MNKPGVLATSTAGLIAMSVAFGAGNVASPAFAGAGARPGAVTDISAQSQTPHVKQKVAPRTAPRTVAPRTVAPRTVSPRVGTAPIAKPPVTRPAGVAPGVVRPGVARVAPSTTIVRGRSVTYVRGPWTVRRGPYVRRYVAPVFLAPILIGAAYYYPYGYLPLEGPYCSGITPDGCELRWQPVPTIDGFVDFQCVAFCPWR